MCAFVTHSILEPPNVDVIRDSKYSMPGASRYQRNQRACANECMDSRVALLTVPDFAADPASTKSAVLCAGVARAESDG